MLGMILDTAPQLRDNVNLFGLDGRLGGGVSLLPHGTTNVLIKESKCNISINHQIFVKENNILFPTFSWKIRDILRLFKNICFLAYSNAVFCEKYAFNTKQAQQ